MADNVLQLSVERNHDYATASNIKKCLDQIRNVPLEECGRTYESDIRYQRLLADVMLLLD